MNGVYGAMNLRWVLKSPSLGSINRLRNPRRNSREREKQVLGGSETLRFKESERRGVTSKSRDREKDKGLGR